ncbi:hypothetical protein TanjilG_10903 [Lupinus angustifolius]|nr:hypothetical protein TanjilG_10903 [Lupinus angustifolius]
MEASGAVEFLASVVISNIVSSLSSSNHDDDCDDRFHLKTGACDEALSVLYNLHLSEAGMKTLIVANQVHNIASLKSELFMDLVQVLKDQISPKASKATLMLVLLEMLCQCAEGRAEMMSHSASLAIVSKKILRASTMANDRALRILLSISGFSATPNVVQEMLQVGVVVKLCLMLQVDCGNKAKENAREILKLHARAWRNSPCIPSNLLDSYP